MKLLYLLSFIFLVLSGSAPASNTPVAMQWSVHSELPPLPGFEVQHGLAGSFSGISGGRLVIAGGANFPESPPWEGGVRRYWSDVYINSVDEPGEWTVIPGGLGVHLAYGVSVTVPQGLLIIGGANDDGLSDEVFLLQLHDNNEINIVQWPSLPVPLAYMTGAMLGKRDIHCRGRV
jgi:N-acetylneuraminic acid mutarotase